MSSQMLKLLCFRGRRTALSLAALLLLTAASSYGQTLTITPAIAPVDQPVAITATGLQPGEEVTIKSELADGADHSWGAEAKFAADPDGKLDLTKTAPLKGNYKGVSAMGLVWSMRPNGDARIYQAPQKLGPQTIRFTLRSRAGSAKAELQQIVLPEDVRLVEVKGALHGVLFLPPDNAPLPTSQRTPIAETSLKRPALLVVGGSEGGTPLRRAAWFASHGYVTLALAYFAVPGLPQQLRDIPLEYFGEGIIWLAQRPEVDPQHIGVVGTSRGGELALQLGSMYPQLHAVVAFVPSNVRVQACCDGGGGAAWTWHGRELAYAMGRSNIAADMRAQIAVEETQGPIMLISGQSDGVWPSSQMTTAAASRLKSEHFKYAVERLDYPNAGHRAGAPEIDPSWHGELRHPISGRPEELGGTPAGNAASGLDAGPRVLAFLANALRPVASAEPPKP